MTFVVVCCCVPLPFRPTLSHAHPRGRAQTAILRDFFVLKCFPSCDFKMHLYVALSLSGTTMNNGFTRDSLVPWLRQTHMRLAMTEETIFKLLGLLIYISHIIKAVIEWSFFSTCYYYLEDLNVTSGIIFLQYASSNITACLKRIFGISLV